MGGLLHLVQRWGDCAGPQPAQAAPRCTTRNSPPINASVPITVLLYNGSLLCGFNVPIKGLTPKALSRRLRNALYRSFTWNSTSAQSNAFSLLQCFTRSVYHGTGTLYATIVDHPGLGFTRIGASFRDDKPQNNCHISTPVTLTVDLMTSKLLCQLLVSWVTSPLTLNVERFSNFELTLDTGRTDGRTDGISRVMRPPMGGSHKNEISGL